MKTKIFLIALWLLVSLVGCAQPDQQTRSDSNSINKVAQFPRNFYGYAEQWRAREQNGETGTMKDWSDWSKLEDPILIYIDWKFRVVSITNRSFYRFILVQYVGAVDLEDGGMAILKAVDNDAVVAEIHLFIKRSGEFVFTSIYNNLQFEYKSIRLFQGYPNDYWDKKDLENKQNQQKTVPPGAPNKEPPGDKGPKQFVINYVPKLSPEIL